MTPRGSDARDASEATRPAQHAAAAGNAGPGCDPAPVGRRDPFPERFLQTRLKLHQLAFLVAVEEERSIVKAAARLNVSQPAATKTLKEIERNLGVQLFERSRRGAVATAYGAMTVRAARLVLAELRHLGSALTSLRTGARGQVVVGTLLAASAGLLPGSIARLRLDFPDISVRIVEGTWDLLLPLLRTGDLDLVLGRVPSLSSREGLRIEELYNEETWIVARPGHPLLAKGVPTLADLLQADWILPTPPTMLRRDIDNAFWAAGHPPPQPVIESVTALANQKLVAQTDLLAFLPREAARFYVENGLLSVIPADLAMPPALTGMLTRSDRPVSPAVSHFSKIVREVAKTLGP